MTVFEKQNVAGGMMTLGIPDYRLPKDVIQAEIQNIVDLGAELHLGKALGTDFTITQLQEDGFEAVVLAVGCHQGVPLDVPGADAEGVFDAVEFLRDLALQKTPAIGRTVAVIGGGDTAIDSARSALRLGAEKVHLVYRRTRDEMPAHPHEVNEAEREGVVFHFLAAPAEVLVENGKVTGLVNQRMRLGDWDRSGRRRPVPVEDSDFTLEVDTIIAAIGQKLQKPELEQCVECAGETICVDPLTCATNMEGVFAGGDAIGGPMTVVDAIGDGHRIARAVHSFLSGEPLPTPRKRAKTRVTQEVLIEMESIADEERPRTPVPCIPDAYRTSGFAEVEQGYSLPAACREAARCLHCDYVAIEEEG